MDETETLGKYLRRERELKKVSLRELSKNTRVREPILKAIEEDRYDLLPSPTFVKGFLSAYAKYIGLDPGEVILRYQQAAKGTPEAGSATPPQKEIGQASKRRWYLGGAILGGMVLLVAVVLYLLQPPAPQVERSASKPIERELAAPSPSPSEIAETAPAPPQPVDTNPPAPAPAQPAATNPPAPSSAQAVETTPPSAPLPPRIGGTNLPKNEPPISIQLKATEVTWVSVKVDNQAEREMTLRPGDSLPIGGSDQIYILIGNAGGLDLIQNGKSLERFGKSGEVVALIFTRQGLAVKRFDKPKSP